MNGQFLTETEITGILTVANEKLTKRAAESVNFILDMASAVSLISQLQLAFRHPENEGVTKQMTERLTRKLIDAIAPEHDEVRQLLLMGFDMDIDGVMPNTSSIACRGCKASFPLVYAIVNGYCPNCREHICPACGCTTSAACPGGCFWLPSGICSSCGGVLDNS